MQRREPPNFLKQDWSQQTLNLGGMSPIKPNDNIEGQRSVELIPFKPLAVGTKREERKPPASIAGESMNLSRILEKL